MASIEKPLAIAGTLLETGGYLQQARSSAAAGKMQRQAYEQAAGQTVAASQYAAQEERRKGQLLASRALAVAGGGAGDPTVVNLVADIQNESAYRAGVALYQGEEQARQLIDQGKYAEYAGKVKKKAYNTKAFSSLLEGATSFYGKYGKTYG